MLMSNANLSLPSPSTSQKGLATFQEAQQWWQHRTAQGQGKVRRSLVDFQNSVMSHSDTIFKLLQPPELDLNSRVILAPDLFMLPYTRLCPLQTVTSWLASTNRNKNSSSYSKYLLLSFSISVNGTIIYLFIQVIYITSLNKWALYLEDNLNFKCLSNNASIPTNWACQGTYFHLSHGSLQAPFFLPSFTVK